MKIINLTPHPVTLLGPDGDITIEPSGTIARVEAIEKAVGTITVDWLDVPVVQTEFGQVTGLPEPNGMARYIVSRVVMSACPDRDDLLVPTQFVRDEQGNIKGAKALSIN